MLTEGVVRTRYPRTLGRGSSVVGTRGECGFTRAVPGGKLGAVKQAAKGIVKEMMKAIGYGLDLEGVPRRVAVVLVALSAVFAAMLLLQEPAHAGESFTWTGKGNDGGNWNNPCNWYPEGECQEKYPGKENPDDTAVLPSAGGPAHAILGENIILDSLTMEAGSSLTGGSVKLNRSLGWTGGSLATVVNLSAGSTGTIDGRDSKHFNGVFNNRGNVLLGPDAALDIAGGAEINNYGTFTAQHGARIRGMTCCVRPPEINNTGTFRVIPTLIPLPGADTVTVSTTAFNAGGTVDVSKGLLDLRGAPGKIATGTRFTGDGTFRITNNAEMTMLGAFNVSRTTDFELSSCDKQCGGGALLGAGTISGNGNFLWNGGSVGGNLTLGPLLKTQIFGLAPKEVWDGKITNLGTVVMSAGNTGTLPPGPLTLSSNDRFDNQGQFIAHEGTSMVGQACCTLPAIFDNTGYFAVVSNGSTQPGTFTAKGLSFRADGDVNVERGALELRQGLGTLKDGLKVTGDGALRVTDRTITTMNGALNIALGSRIALDSCSGTCGYGVLEGEGTLTGGGRFDWLGGTVGDSAILTIAEDSTMRLTGRAEKRLHGVVTNRGSAFYLSKAAPAPATGPLVFANDARFVNYGNVTVGDRAIFKSTVCCVNPARFINIGKFSVSEDFTPSTGLITVDGLYFENRGTTELAAGKLRLGAGGYSQVSGATQLVGGGLESRNLVDILGGKLMGAGTITGNVRNATGATVSPGSPDSVSSTGIIRIVGNYGQMGGTLNADLRGTTPGQQFDQLQVTGQAVLDGATLDLDTIAGFTPGTSTRLQVLTAGERLGRYTTLKDPALPDGRNWYALYPPNGVTLGVR